MTNYEKIKMIIESWHIAQVEYKSWFFQLYSSITSEKHIRAINDSEIKSISVYKRSLRYPKEWELVTILDTIRDEPDYEDNSDSYKEMIGWPFEVKFTNGDSCAVYNTNKSGFDYIDYRHLVPYLWEETNTDDLSKWKEITLTVNGKEYKAIIQ